MVVEKKKQIETKKEIPNPSLKARPKDKEDYYKTKSGNLKWEADNYSKIAILTDTNGMHKMFDHSAIIFVCQVAKRLGLSTAHLIDDTDYGMVTSKPVCLVRNFELVVKKLTDCGMKMRGYPNGVFIFELGYAITHDDLVAMQKENDTLIERANKLVLPSEVFPKLKVELWKLARLAYELVRKMDPTGREAIGNNVVRVACRMCTEFVEAANGHMEMKNYLRSATKSLRMINGELLVIIDLRLYEADKCLRTIQQVAATQRKVSGAMDKIESERKNAER